MSSTDYSRIGDPIYRAQDTAARRKELEDKFTNMNYERMVQFINTDGLSKASPFERLIFSEYWVPEYDIPSKQGIKWFMFNKIRIKLGAYRKRHGWNLQVYRRVMFMDLQMFSIPSDHVCMEYFTREDWLDYPNRSYRKIKIANRIDTSNSISAGGNLLAAIGGGLMQTILGINLVSEIGQGATMKDWEIYPNLISIGGLHDVIILRNWEKVRLELNLL